MRRFLLLLVLFALVGLPVPALAHASYKTSDPPNRSKVSAAPASIWAEFTEPLATGSYLQVYDPCGTRVDDSDTAISGYRMSVTQSSTRAGVYTVRFRALSTLDPHEVNGSFTFTATGGEPCPGNDPEPEAKGDGGGPSEKDETGRSGTQANAGSAEVGSTAEEEPAAVAARDREASRRHNDPAKAARGDGERRNPKRVRVLAARRDRRNGGLFGDIPLGAFAVSLVLSALIGAAGGKVYAGIMGPRA